MDAKGGDGIIVRYDRPRALTCSRAGCTSPAEFKVILLLVPSRTYAGKPWRFQSSNTVCAEHREKVDLYLDEESWKAILDYFDARKAPRPWRAGTRVDFDKIDQGESDG